MASLRPPNVSDRASIKSCLTKFLRLAEASETSAESRRGWRDILKIDLGDLKRNLRRLNEAGPRQDAGNGHVPPIVFELLSRPGSSVLQERLFARVDDRGICRQ